MTEAERHLFERLLEHVLFALPDEIHELFQQVPLIIEDYPSDEIMDQLGLEYADDLAGLHDGVPLIERSVEHQPVMIDTITIYREGILSLSLRPDGSIDPDMLREQIRITILHEVGHHFGLDEDDLTELGYG